MPIYNDNQMIEAYNIQSGTLINTEYKSFIKLAEVAKAKYSTESIFLFNTEAEKKTANEAKEKLGKPNLTENTKETNIKSDIK
jgi:hypothetical protein